MSSTFTEVRTQYPSIQRILLTRCSNAPTMPLGIVTAILIVSELGHTRWTCRIRRPLYTSRGVQARYRKVHRLVLFGGAVRFSRPVVLQYRSFIESLLLSAATINLHRCAIRRVVDEAAKRSPLSPELELASGRVKRSNNWAGGLAIACLGTKQKNC
jgi:hypothetical protein